MEVYTGNPKNPVLHILDRGDGSWLTMGRLVKSEGVAASTLEMETKRHIWVDQNHLLKWRSGEQGLME